MKTFATVCSGIRAPELAWSRLGWRPLFASEIEAFPKAVGRHHFPDVPDYGDMTKFHEWPDSNPDVLCAGTPCQSFSVAGLRAGLADPRGNLALVFLGIVDRYRPRWVLWENVPGVHSSWSDEAAHPASTESCSAIEEAGRIAVATGLDLGPDFGIGEFEEADQTNDFDCFVAALEELGYGVATRIFDAQYFGLAQRRERVFVVGHLGGQWQRAAAVLFEPAGLRGDPPPSRQAWEGIAGTVSSRLKGGGGSDFDCGTVGLHPERIAPTLDQRSGRSGENSFATSGGLVEVPPIGFPSTLSGTQRVAREDLSPALRGKPMAVAHALKADGFDASEDGTGRGTPLIPVEDRRSVGAVSAKWSKGSGGPSGDECQNFIAVSPTLRAGGNKTGGDRPPGTDVDTADSLIPIAFDTTQITSKANFSNPVPGNPCHPLAESSHPPAIAIQEIGKRATKETNPNLHGTGAGIAEPGAPMFTLQSGAQHGAQQEMAVRRLTPRECERLQGFPDDWTLIPFRHKPAADGPRYKAIGNSMAVPVIEWIGRRMDLVDELVPWGNI